MLWCGGVVLYCVHCDAQGTGNDYRLHSPALGTIKAHLMPGSWPNPTVQVQVFKFDTIRQDAYWVTKEVKVFKTMQQAEAYIVRVMA